MANAQNHYNTPNPADRFFAITPSDTVNFNDVTRGIYIGSISGGAVVVVVGLDGQAVTFNGVVAGSVLPVRAIRVNNTNTTASSLVGLF